MVPAATILGLSMAFIDCRVVNVALPPLQSDLYATVVDVQWVIESYGLNRVNRVESQQSVIFRNIPRYSFEVQ